MSSATGIGVRAPLVAAAAACWTLSVWAQAGAPSQAPDSAAATAAQRQRIEDAHDDVRRVTESTSRDAARLSHELGGVVDADPAARPVTRQTFIDRLVFDRIERDGIPHAGLASDEEFVRRVFLAQNLKLVEALQANDGRATSIVSGVFEADFLDRDALGLVGEVRKVHLAPIQASLQAGSIQVIASLGETRTGGGAREKMAAVHRSDCTVVPAQLSCCGVATRRRLVPLPNNPQSL